MKNYKKMKDLFPRTFLIKGYDRSIQSINQQVIDIIKKSNEAKKLKEKEKVCRPQRLIAISKISNWPI